MVSLRDLAVPFVDPGKGIADWEEAIAGARDILAEDMAADAAMRKRLRSFYWREGSLRTQPGKVENPVYESYRSGPSRCPACHPTASGLQSRREG
jgi:uncharacterized protein